MSGRRAVFVLVGATVLTVGFLALRAAVAPPESAGDAKGPFAHLRVFGQALEAIRDRYVDQPDEHKLVNAAINGMVASLDPHSFYVDANAYRAMKSQTLGEYAMVGLELGQEQNALVVRDLPAGSQAAKAGVAPGDIVEAIDGESAANMTFELALEKMRGAAGSSVRVQILRPQAGELKEFELERDVVKIKSVTSRIEGDDIGYLRISQFTEATSDSLKSALKSVQMQIPQDKLKGYILDLRNNPGGFVDQAVMAVNAFVDHGEIVSTRGRNADDATHYYAKAGGDVSLGKPLVVLINGGSASATEIVSGALQDLERATLIGTRSYGKGSVQKTIYLGQDGALRLTTARYYTPSGRSIQARGIEPDIVVEEEAPAAVRAKYEAKGEAALKGHLQAGVEENAILQTFVPNDPSADNQLAAAVALLKERPGAAQGQGRPRPE